MTFAPPALDLEALRQALHAHLGPELLSPAYRAGWSPANPTFGLCSVASEAAWFVLGGKPAGWVAMVARDGASGTHWWLEHRPSGQRFDPTREQYDCVGSCPPYERALPGQGSGFMGIRQDPGSPWGFGVKPSVRARALLEKMLPSADVGAVAQFREALVSAPPRRRPRVP